MPLASEKDLHSSPWRGCLPWTAASALGPWSQNLSGKAQAGRHGHLSMIAWMIQVLLKKTASMWGCRSVFKHGHEGLALSDAEWTGLWPLSPLDCITTGSLEMSKP